jgi:uncharacterized protein YkwD
MHKKTIEFIRLLSPVLLTLLLLVPSHASAAGLAARLAGPEQPDAPFEPTDIPSPNETSDFGYVYTVVAGDDVWLIATAHGISMETLVAANHLESPYWIYPEDRLWVPADPAVVKHPVPEPKKPEKAAPPTDAPVTAPAVSPEPETPAVAVTATVAITPAASPAPEPKVETTTVSASISDPAALILNLINEKRAANGLGTLSWSAELAQAAQGHALDCAERGWGSHVGSDGAHLRTRLGRVGYEAAYTSENWANSRNAQHAFDMWWFEGPGGPHYESIMSGNFSEIGIGVAKGGWGYYVIADFGSR